MTTKQIISTNKAPSPLGHYSQAFRGGGLIHVSGQLPLVLGEPAAAAPFEVQAERVLSNLRVILEASGGHISDVLKVTAYIVGAENWPTFNAVYSKAFGDHKPARSVVPVPALHNDVLIEIDAVAVDPTVGRS